MDEAGGEAGSKAGGNGNFEVVHALWAKLGAKLGATGNAGGNGNFEVSHPFRNSFSVEVRTQLCYACFGNYPKLSLISSWINMAPYKIFIDFQLYFGTRNAAKLDPKIKIFSSIPQKVDFYNVSSQKLQNKLQDKMQKHFF